jgi:hypothetical protein
MIKSWHVEDGFSKSLEAAQASSGALYIAPSSANATANSLTSLMKYDIFFHWGNVSK